MLIAMSHTWISANRGSTHCLAPAPHTAVQLLGRTGQGNGAPMTAPVPCLLCCLLGLGLVRAWRRLALLIALTPP